jgi:hypothetical protein
MLLLLHVSALIGNIFFARPRPLPPFIGTLLPFPGNESLKQYFDKWSTLSLQPFSTRVVVVAAPAAAALLAHL